MILVIHTHHYFYHKTPPTHPLKTLGCFPFQAIVLSHSLTVKHHGVGFPILKLYIKKHFKRTTGEALQGPRVLQYPRKENHLLVGKSLSSPQDHILLPITLAKKTERFKVSSIPRSKRLFTCQSQNLALRGVLFQEPLMTSLTPDAEQRLVFLMLLCGIKRSQMTGLLEKRS